MERPWYAELLARWGFPAALSIGLVYFLVQVVALNMRTLQLSLDAHASASALLYQSMEQNHTRIIENQRLIIESIKTATESTNAFSVILSQICVNGARTAEERRGCFVRRDLLLDMRGQAR